MWPLKTQIWCAEEPQRDRMKRVLLAVAFFSFVTLMLTLAFYVQGKWFWTHMFTIAVATQALAFLNLLVCTRNQGAILGISQRMLVMYVLAYAMRLVGDLTQKGYAPDTGLENYFGCGAEVIVLFLASATIARVKDSADLAQDNGPIIPLLIVCVVMGICFRGTGNDQVVLDALWMTSTWLEATSIWPQIYLMKNLKKIPSTVAVFMMIGIIARGVLNMFWAVSQFEFWLVPWTVAYGIGLYGSCFVHAFTASNFALKWMKYRGERNSEMLAEDLAANDGTFFLQ